MYAQAVKEWSENFKILRRDLFAIIRIAGQYDRKNQSTDAVGGYLSMKLTCPVIFGPVET
ncbi:hypothetical protein WL26_05585 [Burkholderia cepacia]|nr:hypothetical protein WL26_05585 [Burkholderia cepacia]